MMKPTEPVDKIFPHYRRSLNTWLHLLTDWEEGDPCRPYPNLGVTGELDRCLFYAKESKVITNQEYKTLGKMLNVYGTKEDIYMGLLILKNKYKLLKKKK